MPKSPMTSRRAKSGTGELIAKKCCLGSPRLLRPSAWDETDDEEEIDPIAVMGRTDTRSNWVGAITPKGNRGTKSPQHPDLARRYFISREQSPVGNIFEKKKPSGRANSRLMHTAITSGMSGSRRGRCPTVLTAGCVRVLQR